MKKKLLVIGAGNYQVPAIKRAAEMGVEVYCVDYNSHAPGFAFANGYEIIDVCDKQACLEYAQKLNIDGVITYGATITLPTVVYIAEKMHLFAITSKAADLSVNKYLIKKALFEYGLNTKGDFFELRSIEQADLHKFSFPCVTKPCDGSGSKGVCIVNNKSELKEALFESFCNARNGEIYVEGFVKGEEYSVEAFVCNGTVYIYLIVKTDIEYKNNELYYGQTAFLNISDDDEQKIFSEVQNAIEALNINFGSVNFDIIVSDEDRKPYIIDLGIRVGQNLIASHLVPISRGVSELDNIINLALGNQALAKPQSKKFVATNLLTYNSGYIKEIKPFDDLIGKNGIVDVIITRKQGEYLPQYKTKSDICGWVITIGNSAEEAKQNALNAREELKNYIIIE